MTDRSVHVNGEQLNCRTGLADKLSSIADQIEENFKDSCTTSEFTIDYQQFLINSIRKFVTKINQLPSDYSLTCEDLILGLNLKCHPEGGFYQRFSWTKQQTKTFYLLPTGCVSSWHCVNGITETWKWMYGGRLNIPLISNNSRCRWLGEAELAMDKNVIIAEECNGIENWGNWFGAYHIDDNFTLVICECTPAFEFSKFMLANEMNILQFEKSNPDRVEIIELLKNKS